MIVGKTVCIRPPDKSEWRGIVESVVKANRLTAYSPGKYVLAEKNTGLDAVAVNNSKAAAACGSLRTLRTCRTSGTSRSLWSLRTNGSLRTNSTVGNARFVKI